MPSTTTGPVAARSSRPSGTPRPSGPPRRSRSPLRRLRRNAVVLAGCAALAYLLLPNLVVLLFSFNKPAGRFNYSWRAFSTDAWTDPCGVADMCGSLRLSLQIAVLATLIATAFGTFAAFALARYRFRGKSTTNALIFLPMAMPEVVMAASLGTLFLNMRIQFGFITILIAHVMFCLSFVVVAVKARVMSMDPRLEEAARDLYAGPFQTFWRVTLPLAAPGIAAGAMLSFALSFDDFIITQFNAGPSTVTFPMFVWGAAQRGVPVQVNVIGSAMFVLAVALVLGGQLTANRRRRA
ncbi:ABC transporter permease [Streptomyces albus subsp. chlorinus]|uniref:ABC transporter permease n=1 Tax=Streptomyces albus TaxID=1888 RepID=UPI0031F660A1